MDTYEKKYKKALLKARVARQNTESAVTIGILEEIFPELKESEDERMKKELIKFLQECHNIDSGFFSRYCEIPFAQMLAWLEKQGEPTEINPSEFDLRLNKLLKQFETLSKEELISNLSYYLNVIQNDGTYKIEMIDWLQSLRPQNWTKEDKERYISCLQRLGTGNPEQPETINSKWFKEHVYSQTTWKPSDEQIGVIEAVINNRSFQRRHLDSLYNDLKKLREE